MVVPGKRDAAFDAGMPGIAQHPPEVALGSRSTARSILYCRAAQFMPRRKIVAISGTLNSEATWPSEL
jgi:hypothetical protein